VRQSFDDRPRPVEVASVKRGFLAAILLAVPLLAAPPVPPTPPPGRPAASQRLVVLGPRRFRDALHDFIAHKRRTRPVNFVDLESVLKSGEGVDDPEKVKRYLYHEWSRGRLGYALLVGDADVFPVRFMVLDRVTPAAFDFAFYPSDLYYGDLAKADGSFESWNARRDGFHAGYFGEVRGEKNKDGVINFDEVDYRPEIAVGRWPVSTEEEVRRIAAKTIRYETGAAAGTPAGFRTAAFVSVGGWVDSRPLLDRLAGQMPPSWSVVKSFYRGEGRTDAEPPPTEARITELLNRGVGLMFHTGHGNDDAWEQCFFLRRLGDLHNADRLPVMVSIGCSTARFCTLPPYEPYVDITGKEHEGSDHGEVFTAPPPPPAVYQSGRFNPPGLGEQLVRAGDDGAVAYIGCNTGSQPCALTLLAGLIDGIHSDPTPHLGDAWAHAVAFYFEREHLADLKPDAGWYPPSIFFQGMKFMLYGDPSLAMPKAAGH
jgi:Peptidase family C25